MMFVPAIHKWAGADNVKIVIASCVQCIQYVILHYMIHNSTYLHWSISITSIITCINANCIIAFLRKVVGRFRNWLTSQQESKGWFHIEFWLSQSKCMIGLLIIMFISFEISLESNLIEHISREEKIIITLVEQFQSKVAISSQFQFSIIYYR